MAVLRRLRYFTLQGVRFFPPPDPPGMPCPWTLAAMQGQTDEITIAHAGESYRVGWPLNPNRIYEFGGLRWLPIDLPRGTP